MLDGTSTTVQHGEPPLLATELPIEAPGININAGPHCARLCPRSEGEIAGNTIAGHSIELVLVRLLVTIISNLFFAIRFFENPSTRTMKKRRK